jgi:tetratricopeptide (TPR) repeat protein
VVNQSNPDDSLDLKKLITGWVFKHFGRSGVWILACALCLGIIWFDWKDIKDAPGVEPIVTRITEKPLPSAVAGKFNIAVAHLQNDEANQTEQQIRESLSEFKSVTTLSFDRLIAFHTGNADIDERKGHELARRLLKESAADVLIWGVVVKDAGKSDVPKLYWTPARDLPTVPSMGRYEASEGLRLPQVFWRDLTQILGLLVAKSNAEFLVQKGSYQADQLEPFIERVRALLQSSDATQWNAYQRAQVLLILGNALTTYAEQSGRNEALTEAVSDLRESLTQLTRAKAPLDWASAQTKLGVALWILGSRESNPAEVELAAAAFQQSLKERSRDKFPLEWATTQSDLGVALLTLGEQRSDITQIRRAVAAFRSALAERTRQAVPLEWATTQTDLSLALEQQGERELSTARLEEAITASKEALKELKRENAPLDWAKAQNNLGIALGALGEQQSNSLRLNEAVTAFEEALKEFTREKVPFDWAATQHNLGVALAVLGDQQSDVKLLVSSASAFHGALDVYRTSRATSDIRIIEHHLHLVQDEINILQTRQTTPADRKLAGGQTQGQISPGH